MAHAEVDGTEIRVETSWPELDRIKKIPGSRWDDRDKVWRAPLTWAACLQLRGVFQEELTLGPGIREWARGEKSSRVMPALDLRTLTTVPGTAESVYNHKLYDFQKAGVRFLSFAGSALLADEMGTGKTIQTLETLRLAHTTTQDALPAVVICPKSMMGTWAREAKTWFPDAVPYLVEGTATIRRKRLLLAKADPKALVVINFEGVRTHSRVLGFGSIALKHCKACTKSGYAGVTTATCEVHPRELNEIHFRSVVVDEAHRLKDPNAKQTRAVWAVGQGTEVVRRLALTGTPLASNPGDLWSIMHFVAPLEYPGKSRFVTRYCETSFNPWGGMEISGLNQEHRKEFFSILDTRMRRVPKALVLSQLPAKIRTKRFVGMEPKQAKAYQQLEAGMATRLEDGSLMVTKSDLTAQIRLLQFSSAYMEEGEPKKVVDKDGNVEWVPTYIMREPSPKLDAMEEILEEMGNKQAVVCAESRQLIELAEQRLLKSGVSYAMITGKTPQWDRDAQLKEFQEGKRRVMLFTIQAGGVGLTMTAADTIIFLQRSWSMIYNAQAEDRVHRIGSEIHEWINIIDVVASGTVEETQIARLYVKCARMEEINRDREILTAAGLPTDHLDREEVSIMSANLGEPGIG